MRVVAAAILAATIGAIVGVVDAGGASAEQLGGWGRKICWDEDGSVRPCPEPPPPPPPDAGEPDRRGDSRMKLEGDPHDDSFCNGCHVNRTSEVAGPRALRASVLGDPPLFWSRHGVIAGRVVDKRALTNLRDPQTLPPMLQKLMAARRPR